MRLSKEEFTAKFLSDQSRVSKDTVEFTSSQIAELILRYKKGESLRSLSRKFKCSRDTITRRLKLWGVWGG